MSSTALCRTVNNVRPFLHSRLLPSATTSQPVRVGLAPSLPPIASLTIGFGHFRYFGENTLNISDTKTGSTFVRTNRVLFV